MEYDIAVIGGGASGLISAIVAGNKKTIILEKNNRVGKKILATGNGRCNFTNVMAEIKDYHSSDLNIVEEILKKYSPADILSFFYEIGMLHRTEGDGRTYPYSNQATTVLDCLRNRLKAIGVAERTDFKVDKVKKNGDMFNIYSNKEVIKARNVIVATGSMAGEKESENIIYEILRDLGHVIIKPEPALVPLKIKGDFCKTMKGIRAKVTVKAMKDKAVLMEEKGEILFTEYGVSGIAIMQLSRIYQEGLNIEIDFLPEFKYEEILEMLKKRQDMCLGEGIEEYLTGMINKKLGQGIMKVSGIDKLSRKVKELKINEIKKTANNLKHFTLEVTGTTGLKNAQVAKGGVKVSEFDPNTMESKKIKGLYSVGEVLDVDGLCGGFNLHFAWVSGMIAGRAVK